MRKFGYLILALAIFIALCVLQIKFQTPRVEW